MSLSHVTALPVHGVQIDDELSSGFTGFRELIIQLGGSDLNERFQAIIRDSINPLNSFKESSVEC